MAASSGVGRGKRAALRIASVAAMVGLYALGAWALAQPEQLPPVETILSSLERLVTGRVGLVAGEGHAHHHNPDHLSELVKEGVTLQGALLASTLRMLFGLVAGGLPGLVAGLWMGWSRAAAEYLHPLYVLFRSVPPLALIAYVMLWLGHGEAHLLLPIAYAVFTTILVPVYHGTRDVADIYVKAARALGARGRLLLFRVLLPAVAPSLCSGLRYALLISWMTTVGVEMLMSDSGLGHVIVGGGLWSSRLAVAVDPAVVMLAILTVTAAGATTDALMRVVGDRLTAWRQGARRW
jgi:ABC-type nitrate/sulfonate/bicarbonate transport system permease component